MSAQDESFQPPPPPSVDETPRAPRPVKLRPVAIAFFVVGLILVGTGIARVVPGGVSTGAMLGVWGICLFAFSFIPLPVVPNAEQPMSFPEKLAGIFFEPSRVFRNLRAHPHWVGAFAIIVVLTTIYSFAFVQRITAERIVDHMTSKMSEMGPPFAPPPEAIEKMKVDQLSALKNPFERGGTVIKTAGGLFLWGAAIAALCLLAVLVFGGKINYWQALAVVFYAWLPMAVIQKVLGLVILYLKAPEDLHPILNQETTLQDNLGILFSPADHPVLFVLASFIGLTWLYYIWLRAKGLHNAGYKVSSGAAWGVSITLFLVFAFFVTVWTSLFPTFIS